MGTRNFGLGSRDMGKAGKIVLDQARENKQISFSSVATMSQRFNDFADFAKSNGVKIMENVNHDLIRSYYSNLIERGLSTSTIHNSISAVNRVLEMATGGKWEKLTASRDLFAQHRSFVRTQVADGLNRQKVSSAVDALKEAGLVRAAAVVELARDLGLREREASLLHIADAAREAARTGQVTIGAGTKGGQIRVVEASDRAKETLTRLSESFKTLLHAGETYKSFVSGEIRQSREILKEHQISRIHELRAAFAQEKYAVLRAAGESDKDSRAAVSEDLGHHRIEVTNSYIAR